MNRSQWYASSMEAYNNSKNRWYKFHTKLSWRSSPTCVSPWHLWMTACTIRPWRSWILCFQSAIYPDGEPINYLTIQYHESLCILLRECVEIENTGCNGKERSYIPYYSYYYCLEFCAIGQWHHPLAAP